MSLSDREQALPGPAGVPLADPFWSVLRFRTAPVERLLALQPRYGDLFAVAAGQPSLVCAIGAEHNRTVLTQPDLFLHESAFPFRTPKGTAFARFNTSLVLLNGEQHRRHRRLLQPAFARSALDRYVAPIVERCARQLQRWPQGRVVDAVVLIRELTLAAVVSALFGVDLSDSAQTLGRLAVAQLTALSSPLTLLLPLAVPGTPFHRLLSVCEKLEAQLLALIDERRRRGAPSGDVLSILLHAHQATAATAGSDGPAGERLSDTELIGELNTLFVAGHETTANTLSWTLFLLTQHPQILARVEDELAAVLGPRPPTLDDLPRLVFLGRVIDESMRLLPATPVLFMRVCAEPVTLAGHVLSTGTRLALSPLMTHREPTLFPQPRRFDPDRWATLHPTPYQYLPFGAGPRMCLGAAFATQTLRLMLPMILQRFRPQLAASARVDAVVRGISCTPHPGLPITLHAREPGQPPPSAPHKPVQGSITALVDLPQ